MDDYKDLLSNDKIDHDPRAKALRDSILEQVDAYFSIAHQMPKFIPGKSPIPVSGKVYGGTDGQYLVASLLDLWLTTGRFNEMFERKLAELCETEHALTTNSGSSANLLAITALTSKKLGREQLEKGMRSLRWRRAFLPQ